MALELWRDRYRAAPPDESQQLLYRWANGSARIAVLARELDFAHSRVQDLLSDTALRLIVPHLEDLPRWAGARATGIDDERIAALSGTTPTVVALALDGWPRAGAQGRPGADVVVEAHRRWREGAPLREIADLVGVPVSRLRDRLRSGEMLLLPQRAYGADLRERFGWTRSAQALYRRKGVLPPPEGRDGLTYWWWRDTIDSWERDYELHWCDQCQHAFDTRAGMQEHGTREHA